MQCMEFEWNAEKADRNLKKHGVSFLEARSVFDDDEALFIEDPDHSEEEERFILLGSSYKLRILIVVHCEREQDTIRIISSRKATRKEALHYHRRKP
ncbi:MAG: BrnT family toxin [Fibrobacterota bacterium]|nr:MAG: BrnT family toxin [Fibrobacterota bacterium]